MKILVIHPFDPSTEFLREIYANVNATVVRKIPGNEEMMCLIDGHDRIVMLGHGSPFGLFHINGSGYIIHSKLAWLLAEKDNVYVWCHADQFVKNTKLKGFSSGMFISEVSEASMYGIKAPRTEVEISNYAFAFTLGRVIDKPSDIILETVKSEYVDTSSPVINFNHQRMYKF